MRGRRVALLANARSPETLSTAALHTAGLEAVPSSPPLDWRSTPDDYATALRGALADDGIDAVMIVHAPPLADLVDAPVEAIEAAAAGAGKPIVAVMMGGDNGPLRPGSNVPAFAFPEPAAGVLGRVHQYGAWLAGEAATGLGDVGDIDRVRAHEILSAAVDRGDAVLGVTDVVALLRAYGIAAPETHHGPADDAVALAGRIGYPVAVKAEHRHLGRSVRAGVALDLAHDADVAEAVDVMREALGDDAANVTVQAMVAPGLDLRIRSAVDGRLGPMLAVGLGGSTADLVSDEASRLAPLSGASATALLAGSRAGPALGQAGLALEPVVDVLMRVAQLISDHDEIEGVDLNPIIASPDGVAVTDAVVRIGRPPPDAGPLRRLD
jgi:acyl-CoA synthetase (NDP forming)